MDKDQGVIYNLFHQVIKFGAVLFLAATLFDSLFWPNKYNFSLDNYLFPFGLLFFIQQFFKTYSFRVVVSSLIFLFLWECFVSFGLYDQFSFSILSYLLRVLKLPLIFAVSYALVLDKRFSNYLPVFVTIIFYILSAINVIMIMNPMGIGVDLHQLYSPKLASILGNYNEPGVFRLTGTFMNPNDNAQIFGLFFIYYLFQGFKLNWIEIILSISLLFLTQSRTAYLAIIAVFSFGLMATIGLNNRKNIKPLVIFLITALLLVVVMKPMNLVSIFNGTAFHSFSLSTRIQILYEFLAFDFDIQCIGVGSILESISTYGWYFDSEYLHILFQYGYIGLLFYLCFWIVILTNNWKSTSVVSLVIFVIIVSLTNQTLHNPSTSAFIVFLLALLVKKPDEKFQIPASNKPVNR